MPSKLVVDRQKRSILVIAGGREHADIVQAAVAAATRPLLQGNESPPDARALILHMVGLLEAATAAMMAADEAHLCELGDDDEPRTRRDTTAAVLHGSINEAREILTGLFGSSILPALGLASPAPRDAAMLTALGGQVAIHLRQAVFPPRRVEGAKFDGAAWAERIDQEREVVDQALRDVAREAREAETTLNTKNHAIAHHDEVQRRVAGIVASLLEMAGETELAARVRPPERAPRARKTREPDAAVSGAAGDTPPAVQ